MTDLIFDTNVYSILLCLVQPVLLTAGNCYTIRSINGILQLHTPVWRIVTQYDWIRDTFSVPGTLDLSLSYLGYLSSIETEFSVQADLFLKQLPENLLQ